MSDDRREASTRADPAGSVETSALDERLLSDLGDLLGKRCSTAPAVLEHHSSDESWHEPAAPDAVCSPESTEEVSAVVRLCAEHDCPVVPFGAGTALEGHVQATRGGVCIDLSKMSRVLEVNEQDLDCHVEAGVTRKQLQEHLRFTGLHFTVDPGADATIGGMAATGASGTTAVRYGTMRHNVLGLTVVLADGTVIRTGGRARKSSAGYDLTRLMIGSEGTLGVITELWLRLHGVPEATSAAVCQFRDLRTAVDAAITIVQLGVPVARIELVDEVQLAASIRYSKLEGFEETPTLLFEFHDSPEVVEAHARSVGEICTELGGSAFRWATKPEDRSELWAARHNAYYAARALAPGKVGIATDVCVPVSRLADCILETRADLDENELVAPLVGHLGDGNFHFVILYDPEDSEEMDRARAVTGRLVECSLAMGGTCTGEHGVGLGKRDYLRAEHGDAIEVMRRIKHALDPRGILNPGKVLPD